MLRQALEYDPRFGEARARLAAIDYLEDIDRGVEGFKTVIREYPFNVTSLNSLIWDSAMRFWDYSTAEHLLDRIPEHRKDARSYGFAFHIYANTGRPERR